MKRAHASRSTRLYGAMLESRAILARGQNMTLIISKEGQTVRLEKQRFEKQAALQKYIYECPEARWTRSL